MAHPLIISAHVSLQSLLHGLFCFCLLENHFIDLISSHNQGVVTIQGMFFLGGNESCLYLRMVTCTDVTVHAMMSCCPEGKRLCHQENASHDRMVHAQDVW